MDERAAFDGLLHLLEDLVEANDATPILVEGQRDVAALRELGCRGALLPVHTGEPLLAVAERIAGSTREVILLTDWDPKGDRFFDEFRAMLTREGVRCDASFRERIPGRARVPLKDVESLPAHVAKGLARFHGKELADHRASLAEDLHAMAERLREEFPP